MSTASIPKSPRSFVTRNMRRYVAWFFVLLLTGCTRSCTVPCGEFELHDRGILDTATSNGWEMDLDFDFNPDECGVECTCNKVVFVQIVRSVDHEDGTYIYPSSEKEDRAYGRNDDGSFAGTITVGSDTTTANLYDFPRRGQSEPWLGFTWMAVTVPVCIDNPDSSCNNHLLGYYEWAWLVDDAGDVPGTLHWIAPKGFKDDFDDAVSEWNTQAPTLGKNTFPAFTRLSE
ncbi:MAG: hypothetical protein P8Z31_09075 [Gammaproteobacteria bacterium]